MAKVIFRNSGKTLEDLDEIKSFLEQHNILYDNWGTERLPEDLKKDYEITEEMQKAIIKAYEKELKELKEKKGYITEDIVVLSEKTPNLEDLLEKFKKEHHHMDDEVRFVVDGSGVFPIKINGEIVDIYVEEGDLIVVPAGARHWFELDEQRKIKCIRVFKTPEGWEAIYEEDCKV